MAKITEKQLRDICTKLNLGGLKETPYGLRVDRTADGYTVASIRRSDGLLNSQSNALTASEAHHMINGIVLGMMLVPPKNICEKCKVQLTWVPEDQFNKPHWLCLSCGERVVAP